MKIALIGYGKMGQTIEQIAMGRGHEITAKIDVSNDAELSALSKDVADVAIEFTQPDSAVPNISHCIKNNVPIVSGTTGWLDQWSVINGMIAMNNGAFFYASNFSIGVNIFFHLNKKLSKMMNGFEDYEAELEEIHHIHKKDAPSGTGITLAEGVLENLDRKSKWVLNKATSTDELVINAKREGEVPGTHFIRYNSPIDTIEIKHEAHSREGFATGAVLAAEWLPGKQGIFGMDDMLNF